MSTNSDYLRLILLQIDRCNSSKPDDLYDATLKLRLLCEPLSDEQWKEEIGNIERELKSEAEYEELEPDKTVYYRAGINLLSSCISLLKRKGLI
jgi:hypothetical protein